MKTPILTLALAGLLFGNLLPLEARPREQPAVRIPGADAWKNPDELSEKLAGEIRARLKGFQAKDIHMQLLLMYYLARSEKYNQQALYN